MPWNKLSSFGNLDVAFYNCTRYGYFIIPRYCLSKIIIIIYNDSMVMYAVFLYYVYGDRMIDTTEEVQKYFHFK